LHSFQTFIHKILSYVLTFSEVASSVLIFKALLTPKEAVGAKAAAGTAKARVASASFILNSVSFIVEL
jgi:hypothetical protein